MRLPFIAHLIALCFLPFVSVAMASSSDETILREGLINNDVYLAGERVTVDADAKGDVVIAANVINVKGQVDGDLLAAGAELSVSAQLNDDARLVGAHLSICSQVMGDLVLAGADINTCEQTKVMDNAFMAGKDLTIDGQFDGNLTAKGARITLAGTVTGNTNFEAEKIEILSNAVINGDLRYKSPNPAIIREGAVINGEEIYDISESSWWANATPDSGALIKAALWLLVIGVIGLTIAGFVLSVGFPDVMHRTTTIAQSRVFTSMGIGLVFSLVTPVLIILLLLTLIGAPLAILALLAFVLMLLIGFYTSLICIADLIASLLRRKQPLNKLWRAITLLLAALTVTLIGVVPIIGGITLFLVYITGVGAVFSALLDSRRDHA